jgi:hypothetical protein
VFSAGYSVSVFTDWSDKAVVWVKRRVDQPVSKWTAGRQAQQGAAVDRLKILFMKSLRNLKVGSYSTSAFRNRAHVHRSDGLARGGCSYLAPVGTRV